MNYIVKRVVLVYFFGFISVIAFASFPVEAQSLIIDTDPESFKLDAWGFIIGILTTPFLLLFGLPLLLLFINKKNFRRSLAFGWLAGVVLIILIAVLAASEFVFLY